MRKDMAKVIVDDYSSHNGKKFRYHNMKRMQNKLHNDPEYYGNRMSMSPARSYGWDTRNSPDRLQPLQGYLEKHIGEPWDNVYSDIIRSLKRGGFGRLLNRHLLEDHLKYMVFKKVIKEKDGTLIAHSRWWCREIHEGDLYVDPDTGILSIVGASCIMWKPAKTYTIIETDKYWNRYYATHDVPEQLCIDGVWVMQGEEKVTLKPYPSE